jgi:hypothetical protein
MFPNAMGMNNNVNGMGGGMMGMPNMGMGNSGMFNQFGGNNGMAGMGMGGNNGMAGMGMGGNNGMAGMGMGGMTGMNMGMGNPGMFNQFNGNNGMPGMNMPNMGMQMQGMNNPLMGCQGMNMAGQNPNLEGGNANADWLAGYNMAMKENEAIQENAPDAGNKINCVFKTTQGVVSNVLVEGNKTMGELLKIYLKRMGKEELIGKKDMGVCFLYNATKIDFSNKTTIEDFFHLTPNPTLIVNDVNNLIGA